jgi:hypothetical protein
MNNDEKARCDEDAWLDDSLADLAELSHSPPANRAGDDTVSIHGLSSTTSEMLPRGQAAGSTGKARRDDAYRNSRGE